MIHESIEGCYDLTGQDLIEIHDLLVDANLKAYQISRDAQSKAVPNVGAEDWLMKNRYSLHKLAMSSIDAKYYLSSKDLYELMNQFASQSQGESKWVDMKELFTTIRGVIAMSNGSP